MGVPSFYRWLVNKYPKLVVDAIEEKGDHVDWSLPNPNGLEFDNLYLDMNAIIHPCFHPEDNLFPPTTFDEVFLNIYEYIDRLCTIVRPRKLLFLAIDGVAPRAKMNQQRSRRFRTAKDIQVAEQMEDKLRKEFELEGKILLPKEESQVFDSNVITPGTEFMYTLSRKLESYIRQRISDRVAWRNIKVILSDANNPGEGEHKIMSFIRAQRASPGYDPNTRHCLYGLDADLIMLALTTHEIHFSIIREDILSQKEQAGHLSALEHSIQSAETCSLTSKGWFNEKTRCSKSEKSALQEECVGTIDKSLKKKHYQFLHIWIMREYLALDLEITCPPEKFHYDFEKIIDDFILICFFAGNDFLPHMPCLEIHEGAIDLLMHVYRKEFKNLGGYLVDMEKAADKKCGYIKLKRVERFLLAVGKYEDQIFMKRAHIGERKLRRILSELADAKDNDRNDQQYDETTSDFDSAAVVFNKKSQKEDGRENSIPGSTAVDDDQILKNTKDLKQKMKDYLRDQSDLFKDGYLGTDKVKFGTVGWKERYYKEKFSTESPEEMETTRKDVISKYGEGLCWVLLYYFSGTPSWNWFYPFYYGPLASDFKGLSQTKVNFIKGLPFKPFDQLMGVLPPKSAHALPMAYKRLMTDENSVIIDFYPTEFETDVDGKRYIWQGICKLPFIDENRLLIETKKLEDELKDQEKSRNLHKPDLLLVASSSKLGNEIISCSRTFEWKNNNGAIKMNNTQMGIDGTVHPISADGNYGDECSRNVIAVFYETRQGFQHLPRLLEQVNIPEKIVSKEDIIETKLWHEERGRNISYCNRFQNQFEPIKPERNMESHPKSCVLNVVSKGASSGFMGRGKTSTTTLPTESFFNSPTQAPVRAIGGLNPLPYAAREHVSSSSNTLDSRMRDYQPSDMNGAKYNFSGRSKPGICGGEFKGFEDLSIYRSQQPRGVNYNNPRQVWRSNTLPSATPLGNGQRGPVQGSSVHTWKNNQPSPTAATPLGNGPRGPGQGSSVHTWKNNQPSPTAATPLDNGPRGPGQGSYVHAWKNNQPSPTAATPLGNGPRGPGQGSYVHAWKNNQPSPTAAAPLGNGPRGPGQGSNVHAWKNNQPSPTAATPLGNGPRGPGQGSSVHAWKNNQPSPTASMGRGRGRGW